MKTFENLEHFYLDNGLEVILMPEEGHRLVTYQVWYRVGSRYESDAIRGMSHFIEHLFFKGTEKYGPGVVDRKLNELGAFNNAATSKDYTFYYCVGIQERFEEMFEVQTEMLLHPAFDPHEIEKEREVVIAEIHRANDNPTHQFYYKTMASLYREHSYSQPVLGYEDIIRSLSPETIRGYYETHYHPANMTVVIVGAFSAKQGRDLVEAAFGPLKARNDYQARGVVPLVQVPGKELFYAPTQRNYSGLTFLGPSREQPQDILALDLLSTILTDGKSSRWAKQFKEDLNLVESISLGLHTSREQSPLNIQAAVKNDEWLNYHEAMDGALDKLRRFYVTREEFHTAKEYELVQTDFRWRKLIDRAESLGFYASMEQLSHCLQYRELVKHLRIEDIVRVIEKYLTSDPVVTQMLPEHKEEPVYLEEESVHGCEYTTQVLDSQTTQVDFSSGLKLVYRQDKDVRIASADLFARNLSEIVARFPAGTGHLMQKLLSKGTATLSREQIMETMDKLGARYSTVCSDVHTRKDNYRNSLLAPVGQFFEAFSIFSSFFTQASFIERETQKSRDSILQDIQALPDSLTSFCLFQMMKHFFEGHPYGVSFLGTEQSMVSITRKDIEELYSVLYNPSNLFLSISGSYPLEEVIEKVHQDLNRNLGVLNVGFKDTRIPEKFDSPFKGQVDVSLNRKEQAYLMRLYLVPGYLHPDFHKSLILNEILGGGMSSRYFRNLRDEKSYGYEVGSNFISYMNYGLFYSYLGTDPNRISDASKDFQAEIDRIKDELVSDEELSKAKNLIASRHCFGQETLADQSGIMGNYLSKGLSFDFYEGFLGRVQEITASELKKFAKTYFNAPFEQRIQPQKD
jgi:zinc protease